MTMKQVFFFAQILISGVCASHSLSLTQAEADAHLRELKQDTQTTRAYMVNLDKAFI